MPLEDVPSLPGAFLFRSSLMWLLKTWSRKIHMEDLEVIDTEISLNQEGKATVNDITHKPVQPTPEQQQRRQSIQALIDAVAVSNPDVKERLTLGAVWQFLSLPDSSYGWNASGSMPTEVKCLCILNSLVLGLMPGSGMYYWLGNRFYISNSGLRHIAQSTPDIKFTGDRKLRPMTDAEKAMFGLVEGDLSLVIEQPMLIKGEILTAVGYGIIGADEKSNSVWGKTKKNVAMNLYTRAERDLYQRFLPLRGNVGEPDELEREQMDKEKLSAKSTKPSRPGQTIDLAPTTSPLEPQGPSQTLVAARMAFASQVARVAAAGQNPDAILNYSAEKVLANENAAKISNACDVLRDWKPPTKDAAPTFKAELENVFSVEPQPHEGNDITPNGNGSAKSTQEKALDTILRLLADEETDDATRSRLEALRPKKFNEGDYLLIAAAARHAKAKNYRYLDGLISERSNTS